MPKFAKRLLVAAILLLVLAAILHMGGMATVRDFHDRRNRKRV